MAGFGNDIKKLYWLFLLPAGIVLSCKNQTTKEPLESGMAEVYATYMQEINDIPAPDLSDTSGMMFIKGGTYQMGADSDQSRPDEFPAHAEQISDLWVDTTEVTNAQFQKFIEATNYITTAERSFKVGDSIYPPGALIFDPENKGFWWTFMPGANWKHPYGPQSSIEGKETLPVVQVSWYDAMAYARWAGKRLPTEAEFEYLSRGGIQNQKYPWGNDLNEGPAAANFFQGHFPVENEMKDGFEKLSTVAHFPANSFGLYDISGNVWEWCLDTYYPNAYGKIEERENGYFRGYYNADQNKVVRGGSYLCSESYCTGYRSAARMSSAPDTGLEHTGFRCVMDVKKKN